MKFKIRQTKNKFFNSYEEWISFHIGYLQEMFNIISQEFEKNNFELDQNKFENFCLLIFSKS